MQCGRLSGPRRLEARGAGRIRLGSIVCCAAARPARRTPAGPSTGLSGLVGVGMPAGHAQGPRLVRQPQPKDNPAAISGPGMDSAPGPVSGMHQTRAGARLLNAAQCGPCYARARCGLPAGCVSGVLGELVGAGAFSTRPVSSQRLARLARLVPSHQYFAARSRGSPAPSHLAHC